ncbi:MAG TPA: hypothetical protein VIO36_10155 [Anaerolineaceae bacterium]
MADAIPPPTPPEDSKPKQAAQLSPRTTAALEFSKIILPVIGTIVAACLSGIFLMLNSSGFFQRKDPTATPVPTAPLVEILPTATPLPPMPTPRPTETPLPQPTEIGWTLRFADDFSDPASGWPVMKDDPDVVKEYADGGYLVTLIKDNIDTFTRNTYAEVLSDVRVEVDALRIGDQTPWDIGLACRIDGMAVYQLSVYESNGVKKYGIYRWNEESYITLAEKIVTDNRVFREGKIANQFRADCVGDHLTLWINGEKVLEATDPNPLPRGKAGLVAGYADGVQVFYDNFAVYIP